MKKKMLILTAALLCAFTACGSANDDAGQNAESEAPATETMVDPKKEEYEKLQGQFDYVIEQAVTRDDGMQFLIRDHDQYFTDVTWDEDSMLLKNSSGQLPSCVITYSEDHSEINLCYDDSVHAILHLYMKDIYSDLGVTVDVDQLFEDHDAIAAEDGLISVSGEKGPAAMNELFGALGAPTISNDYSYDVTVKLNQP